MRSLIPLSLLLTIFDTAVNALKFPFEVRFPHPTPSLSLNRRTPLPVRNIGNAQYVSNITLAGQTLPVLLDTGRFVHQPTRFKSWELTAHPAPIFGYISLIQYPPE